jgi:hypothetical protein
MRVHSKPQGAGAGQGGDPAPASVQHGQRACGRSWAQTTEAGPGVVPGCMRPLQAEHRDSCSSAAGPLGRSEVWWWWWVLAALPGRAP